MRRIALAILAIIFVLAIPASAFAAPTSGPGPCPSGSRAGGAPVASHTYDPATGNCLGEVARGLALEQPGQAIRRPARPRAATRSSELPATGNATAIEAAVGFSLIVLGLGLVRTKNA